MGVNDTDRTIWRRAMDALLIVKYSQKATANKQTNKQTIYYCVEEERAEQEKY